MVAGLKLGRPRWTIRGLMVLTVLAALGSWAFIGLTRRERFRAVAESLDARAKVELLAAVSYERERPTPISPGEPRRYFCGNERRLAAALEAMDNVHRAQARALERRAEEWRSAMRRPWAGPPRKG